MMRPYWYEVHGGSCESKRDAQRPAENETEWVDTQGGIISMCSMIKELKDKADTCMTHG